MILTRVILILSPTFYQWVMEPVNKRICTVVTMYLSSTILVTNITEFFQLPKRPKLLLHIRMLEYKYSTNSVIAAYVPCSRLMRFFLFSAMF